MTINVQCVYGDDDIENVRSCIIPNLAAATKEKVIFLTMNYAAAGKRLDSGDPYGCEVWLFRRHQTVGQALMRKSPRLKIGIFRCSLS